MDTSTIFEGHSKKFEKFSTKIMQNMRITCLNVASRKKKVTEEESNRYFDIL
jgi:hypothetical protein